MCFMRSSSWRAVFCCRNAFLKLRERQAGSHGDTFPAEFEQREGGPVMIVAWGS